MILILISNWANYRYCGTIEIFPIFIGTTSSSSYTLAISKIYSPVLFEKKTK